MPDIPFKVDYGDAHCRFLLLCLFCWAVLFDVELVHDLECEVSIGCAVYHGLFVKHQAEPFFLGYCLYGGQQFLANGSYQRLLFFLYNTATAEFFLLVFLPSPVP